MKTLVYLTQSHQAPLGYRDRVDYVALGQSRMEQIQSVFKNKLSARSKSNKVIRLASQSKIELLEASKINLFAQSPQFRAQHASLDQIKTSKDTEQIERHKDYDLYLSANYTNKSDVLLHNNIDNCIDSFTKVIKERLFVSPIHKRRPIKPLLPVISRITGKVLVPIHNDKEQEIGKTQDQIAFEEQAELWRQERESKEQKMRDTIAFIQKKHAAQRIKDFMKKPSSDKDNFGSEIIYHPDKFYNQLKKLNESVKDEVQIDLQLGMFTDQRLGQSSQLHKVQANYRQNQTQRWIKNPVKHLNEESNTESEGIAKKINHIIKQIQEQEDRFSPDLQKKYKSIKEVVKQTEIPFLPELKEDFEYLQNQSKMQFSHCQVQSLKMPRHEHERLEQPLRRKTSLMSQIMISENKEPTFQQKQIQQLINKSQTVAESNQTEYVDNFIKNQKLELIQFAINEKVLKQLTYEIKNQELLSNAIQEILLDQVRINDVELAELLGTVMDQIDRLNSHFQRFTFVNNSKLGPNSIAFLGGMLQINERQGLKELSLKNIKLAKDDLGQLFKFIGLNLSLTKLSLSQINLREQPLNDIFSFLQNNFVLQELDLSWTSLSQKQQINVWKGLQCTQLQSLNMSFAVIGQDAQVIKNMIKFITTNKQLKHLNLVGCLLGKSIREIAPTFREAKSLLSIHLSDNQFTEEDQKFLFRQLSVYADNEHGQRIKTYSVKEHASIQRLKELRAAINSLQSKDHHSLGRITNHNEQLTLVRMLDHCELNLFASQPVQRWRTIKEEDCWVCQKSKYVIYFYNRWEKMKNKMLGQLCQWFVLKLVQLEPSLTIRMVPPVIQFGDQRIVKMSPMLDFASKLDNLYVKRTQAVNHSIYSRPCAQKQALMAKVLLRFTAEEALSNKLDVELNDFIGRNLNYNGDRLEVNKPSGFVMYGSTIEACNHYVWAGFVKPGSHKITIIDPLNLETFQSNLIVEPRSKYPSHCEQPESLGMTKVMQLSAKVNDVFANWLNDNRKTLDMALEFDNQTINFGINLPNYDLLIIQKFYKQLRRHYSTIVELHTILASHSKKYPRVDWEICLNMLRKSRILRNGFNEEQAKLIYSKYCESKNACRPEFTMFLIDLACQKFIVQPTLDQKNKNKPSPTSYAEALDQLFNEHLTAFTRKRNWGDFREKFCKNSEVLEIFQDNLYQLMQIYRSNLVMKHGRCCFISKSALRIVSRARENYKIKLNSTFKITNKQQNICWGLSKMTIKDFSTQKQLKHHMVFVEFLEYILRVIYIAKFSESMVENQSDSSGRECISEESEQDQELSSQLFLFTKKRECSSKYVREVQRFVKMIVA